VNQVRAEALTHGSTCVTILPPGLPVVSLDSPSLVRMHCLPLDASPVGACPMDATSHQWESPLRVIVVDDDSDQAYILTILLRLWGHDVRAATNAAQALDLLAAWQPEVALLDLAMPHMDGLHLASTLRTTGATNDLALVALTGSTCEAHRRQAEDLGFAYYLLKPSEPEQLRQVLETLAQVRNKNGEHTGDDACVCSTPRLGERVS
jgi:CheY-like chemotaxis protein